MVDLHTLKALGAQEPRADTFDGLVVSENDSFALASLSMRRGKDDQFNRVASKLFGIDMPKPGKMIASDPYRIFWAGPDQYYVEAPIESHENLDVRLKKAFKTSASLTEQTGGWARFVLAGDGLNSVMERLTMLDIHAMASGECIRTTIDHLGVFVLCEEAGKQLTILGPRSSAVSLHHAIVTAAASAL